MNIDKSEILNRICYTELVYGRINKKLKAGFSQSEIERMLFDLIRETPYNCFQRKGKNIYVVNPEKRIRVTINSNTFRIITVDRLTV